MASNTYVALQTATVTGSAVPYVDFTSIPQGYTDLVVVANVSDSSYQALLMFLNGTTTGYSWTYLNGDGTSATSGRYSNEVQINIGLASTTPSTNIIHLQNYSNTTTYKTVLCRANVASNSTRATVALWRNTAAITSIRLQGTSIQVGSTFTIYGIAAASVGAKATGGTIYQDASYFYHVFSGNGTFTPSQSISADILSIAGGGGGGNFGGGGGGAGGLLGFTAQSLTATGYTVTVGAGGAGAAANSANYGVAGSNSQFGALTACVGGGRGGGRATSTPGSTGGSGGGNAYSLGSLAGTSGQGYAGGAGTANGGGGGGGAGEAGNTDAGQGAGGDGVDTYSSWGVATGVGQNVSGTYWFAGGGGGWGDNAVGGDGGLGGGGTGSGTSVPSGLAYTGSGGGATAQTYAGGNGGSGVIVVRYAK